MGQKHSRASQAEPISRNAVVTQYENGDDLLDKYIGANLSPVQEDTSKCALLKEHGCSNSVLVKKGLLSDGLNLPSDSSTLVVKNAYSDTFPSYARVPKFEVDKLKNRDFLKPGFGSRIESSIQFESWNSPSPRPMSPFVQPELEKPSVQCVLQRNQPTAEIETLKKENEKLLTALSEIRAKCSSYEQELTELRKVVAVKNGPIQAAVWEQLEVLLNEKAQLVNENGHLRKELDGLKEMLSHLGEPLPSSPEEGWNQTVYNSIFVSSEPTRQYQFKMGKNGKLKQTNSPKLNRHASLASASAAWSSESAAALSSSGSASGSSRQQDHPAGTASVDAPFYWIGEPALGGQCDRDKQVDLDKVTGWLADGSSASGNLLARFTDGAHVNAAVNAEEEGSTPECPMSRTESSEEAET